MNYSAGMISRLFWYIEAKKTAKYMIGGLNTKICLHLYNELHCD